MRVTALGLDTDRLLGPLPAWRATCTAAQWQATALAVAEGGGRLVSLWGSDRRDQAEGAFVVSAALAIGEGLVWLDLPLSEQEPAYPDLAGIFPCAARMQRAVFDLLGVDPKGAVDLRYWLNHGDWPGDFFPLRREVRGDECLDDHEVVDYPFIKVEGDGVHEIPVGPVHAGIIEPGHFRFSIVGEKVLRLEERLGYTHKGIDKRFEKLSAEDGVRLAGRVSGDSTVAYAWAYSMALESIGGTLVPPRAASLRALMLERERIANHLGDLGALGNDAAFSFGLAQFMCLKEDWLRLNGRLFGHRFMMDRVLPGGVAVDIDDTARAALLVQCDAIEHEVRILRRIYDDHAGLQDRFITTGTVTPQLATQLGLTGLAGRASGIAFDLRADFPVEPYGRLDVRMATHRNGDVAARVTVRFEEVFESLRLIRLLLKDLPAGAVRAELSAPDSRFGAGWVEGWRGGVFVALEVEAGRVRRCHCHDPSWQNWPVLEHAVIGDIVPDFPLINKSFNLSYAGHDR